VRNSDKQASVTWTNNANAGNKQPYNGIYVDRQTNGTGAWLNVANVSGSSTGWTDTGLSTNKMYQYRVCAYNNAGNTNHVYSSAIYTTPAAPTSVTATKTGASAVKVSWSDPAAYEEGYKIERTTVGSGTWSTLTTVSSNITSYQDASAPAGTIKYRVSSYRGSLYSSAVETGSVTTIAKPGAPTLKGIPSGTLAYGDASFTLSWVPNHSDSSEQQKAELDIDGTVTAISGNTTTWEVKDLEVGTHKFRVRTYGLYDGWGDWCEYQYVTVANLPAVGFVELTSPITELPITLEWASSDPTGIAGATLTVKSSDGVTVVSKLVDGSGSIELGTTDYPLNNFTDYTATLIARSGNGLQNTATTTFSTDYIAPADPAVAISNDAENARVYLQVSFAGGSTGINADTVSIDIERVTDDLVETIATGLTDGMVCTDYTPPINYEYSYRITAWAASGTSVQTTITNTLDVNGSAALNYGDGLENVVLLRYNLDETMNPSVAADYYYFAGVTGDSGLEERVMYPSQQLATSITASGVVCRLEDANAWRKAFATRGKMCWRSADGGRYMVHANGTVNRSSQSYGSWAIGVTMECVADV
jgi:hypothetical protein